MCEGFDKFGRPKWDTLYMALAFMWSQRSLDPSTKHGCVVVDSEHTLISSGYNSPPRGCNDYEIPLTRPEKYYFMEHAEINSIINAARTGTSLNGSTFYITGHPCVDCYRKILNVGAKYIVYGPLKSNCINKDHMKAIEIMERRQSLGMHEYEDMESVYEVLLNATDAVKKLMRTSHE